MFLRISSSTQAALSLIRTFTLVSLSLRFFLTKFFHPSLRAQFARATRLKKKKPYPIYYLLPISPEPVTLTTMPKLYTIRPSFTTAYSVRNRFSTRNYTIQQPWFHLAFSAFPGQSVRAASRSKGKKKKKKKKKKERQPWSIDASRWTASEFCPPNETPTRTTTTGQTKFPPWSVFLCHRCFYLFASTYRRSISRSYENLNCHTWLRLPRNTNTKAQNNLSHPFLTRVRRCMFSSFYFPLSSLIRARDLVITVKRWQR